MHKASEQYIDCHVHAGYSHPVPLQKNPEQYIIQAIENSLSTIGFTEHAPLPIGFIDPAGDSAMTQESLIEYQEEIQRLQSKYKDDITLLISLEIDYIEGSKEYYSRLLEEFPYDYCIGSVHFLENKNAIAGAIGQVTPYWGFDFSAEYFHHGVEGRNIQEIVKEYYNKVEKLLEWDFVNVVGHLDLIKKYNKDNMYFSKSDQWYQRLLEAVLQKVRKSEKVLDVNTAGIRKECRECYPASFILQKAHALDISISLGSDAHFPQEVANGFNQTRTTLHEIGYTEAIYFSKKQPVRYTI